jgi:hypothetical protein
VEVWFIRYYALLIHNGPPSWEEFQGFTRLLWAKAKVARS